MPSVTDNPVEYTSLSRGFSSTARFMLAPFSFARRSSALWTRGAADFYLEPAWCAERLFAVEKFEGGCV